MSKKNKNYFKDAKDARKVFGVRESRPQDEDKELYKYRRMLNYGLMDSIKMSLEAAQGIRNFQPTKQMKEVQNLKMYPQEVSVVFVDTSGAFQDMIDDLNSHVEIAVDLEGHMVYSLCGMTALIQISTAKRDYLICPFAMRKEIRSSLKAVFENPEILKVFHAIENDFLSLLRDFGITPCGLIDSKEVWKVVSGDANPIGFNNLLSNLGIREEPKGKAEKRLAQLADWRLRPLPESLQIYARHDTHALLRAWDCIKRKFGNQLEAAFTSTSNVVLALTYKLPKFEDPLKGLKQVEDDLAQSDDRVKFIDLHRWRLQLARMVDCSPQKIISNKQLVEIIQAMPGGHTEMQQLLDDRFPAFLKGRQGTQFYRVLTEGLRNMVGYEIKCHNCALMSHQAWACWKKKDPAAWKSYMNDPANAVFKRRQFERRMRKWKENRGQVQN